MQLIVKSLAAWKEGFVAEVSVTDKDRTHLHISKKAAFSYKAAVGVAEITSSQSIQDA
jgi:hypothetical protein